MEAYIILKNILDEKGIKYSFLADKMKINKSVLSAILKGTRKFECEELERIIDILNQEFKLEVDANTFIKASLPKKETNE